MAQTSPEPPDDSRPLVIVVDDEAILRHPLRAGSQASRLQGAMDGQSDTNISTVSHRPPYGGAERRRTDRRLPPVIEPGSPAHARAAAVGQWTLILEGVAFLGIIALIWLDAAVDLPHLLFGARATPSNLSEAAFECLMVSVVGAVVVFITSRAFQRIHYLESFVVMCAWCGRVRAGEKWTSVAAFLWQEHEGRLSHGICADCDAAQPIGPQQPTERRSEVRAPTAPEGRE